MWITGYPVRELIEGKSGILNGILGHPGR